MSLGLPCRRRSRDFRLAEQICSHARAAVYRPLLVPDDHRVVQGGVLLGTQVLLQAVFIFLTAFATPAAPETTPAASTRNPHGPLNLPCSTNPENVCGLRRFLGCMALGSNGCELSCGRGELGKRGS